MIQPSAEGSERLMKQEPDMSQYALYNSINDRQYKTANREGPSRPDSMSTLQPQSGSYPDDQLVLPPLRDESRSPIRVAGSKSVMQGPKSYERNGNGTIDQKSLNVSKKLLYP